jgi:tRNA(Arg) A34 adenosine deaminase TadA
MDRHCKYLTLLATAAEGLPTFGQARMMAAIVKHNQIISFGVNSSKTDPLAKRFAKNEHAHYPHAELSAIKNAINSQGPKELINATLYVARSKFIRLPDKTLKPQWGIACPCKGCKSAIYTFGIKNVFYTTDETGIYEELRVK